ncbi:MAG: DUF5069 domain-containing protein [Verrucomicrobiota bacterium]
MASSYPCSPKEEIEGLPYFRRMCDKIRLYAAGELHPDLHANLGIAMDLWTCQFLGVTYEDLKNVVTEGADDEATLAWAREKGMERPNYERDWWIQYMQTCGFRDRLATRLQERIEESGLQDRPDVVTMFDYIDADEGR